MRRFLVRRLAVLILAFFIVLPASAAPRRDDTNPSFFQSIIKIIRRVLPFEDVAPAFPKP